MSGVYDFESKGTLGASLRPERFDIELYRGDSFAFEIELEGDNGALDLTGWTGIAQIKKVSDSTPGEAPFMEVEIGDGVIRVLLDSASSEDLLGTTLYKYDVQITDAAGGRRTFVGGLITVTEDVSQ